MHKAKLIILTVLVVVVGGAIYVWMQPSHKPAPTPQVRLAQRPVERPGPPATAAATQSVIHSGEQVWVQVPDEKTGKLAWRFRAARYDPQPDNSVNVSEPQAEYFFAEGQSVTIRGSHGRVVVPGEAGKSSDFNSPAAPPSRGELYDVTISLIHADRPKQPVLVCKVNNVAFDNDTFRIATESFKKPDGTTVSADQVPVEVRGQEYDFDGRGLVIRWNDRDRRLQSLEIAHGESLTVKNLAERLGETEGGSPTTLASAVPRERGRATSRPATAPRQAAVAQSTTRSAQPIYRATFDGGVRVTQGDQQLARADTMAIDFRLKGEPAEQVTAPSPRQPRPATAATRSTARGPSTASAATTRPDNRHLPAVIRWPGKLVIVPVETGPQHLEPGEMAVELASATAPTHANYMGWDILCAALTYVTGGPHAELRSSSAVPLITVKEPNGSVVSTPSLRFDGPANRIVLEGASKAEIRTRASPEKPSESITLAWTRSGVITVAGSSQQDLTIQQADISGDVDLQHPKVKLKSRELQVALAPSIHRGQSTPQVKQLVAVGDVKCDLSDEQQGTRHITTERLTVDAKPSADGEFQPHKIIADGNVRTFDDDGELTAGHLEATLAPTTQPTDPPRVESVLVQQDVLLKWKQGGGRADLLTATAEGDDYNIRLQGEPAASIGNDESTLTGRIINVRPGRQTVEVVGAGSVNFPLRESAQAKPTRVDVTWEHELNFDGKSDSADIKGNVVIANEGSDGARNSASGQRLTLVLMDDPKAATRPVKPATQPRDPLTGGFEALANKTVRKGTLDGQTELQTVLADANGALMRRFHLFAPSVVLDMESGSYVVPQAGRALYEDLRPTTQPTSAPAASPLGDLSGATAIQWSGKVEFDQASNRLRLLGSDDGDVAIVHQGLAGGSEPFRLDARQITVDFHGEAPDAAKPGNQLMPSISSMQFKLATAEGNVHFTARQIQFDAEQISYDPSLELITARGSDGAPVQVYDSNGTSAGSFLEVSWETRTQRIKHVRNVQAVIRR
jgi:lipopolysaccharide export system protein LptA